MRMVAAFLLLTVFAGARHFLTFTSSWEACSPPQAQQMKPAVAVELTPMPDWEEVCGGTASLSCLRTRPFVYRGLPAFSHRVKGGAEGL